MELDGGWCRYCSHNEWEWPNFEYSPRWFLWRCGFGYKQIRPMNESEWRFSCRKFDDVTSSWAYETLYVGKFVWIWISNLQTFEVWRIRIAPSGFSAKVTRPLLCSKYTYKPCTTSICSYLTMYKTPSCCSVFPKFDVEASDRVFHKQEITAN